MQATIFNDEATLERVLAHEMAHHAVTLDAEAGDGSTLVELIRDPARAHGAEWKEYAKKINQAVGDSSFVTEFTDHKPSETSKSYYLWIEHEARRDQLRYAVASSLSAGAKTEIDRGLRAGTGKLVKVTDPQWLNGPRIGKGSMVPKSPELKAALKKLWDEN
jgi:class 3 adenylate cyclase